MPSAETGSGRLGGRALAEGVAFLGVPYAAASRWTPPVSVAGWTGTLDATGLGPSAPQPERAVSTFTHGELPPGDESHCLNLNVFTPALAGARPVLVWIHGGGFAIGHGGASIYWGEHLARAADVVVVTINYRLGSLGWLAHPGLAAEPGGAAGNWGLLDQLAALSWVRDNIAAFGGDPRRVTLAGQSAGALAAMDLLVSPAAEGLFGRVILQSPPLGDAGQSLESGVRWAEALSQAAGGDSGRLELERLRSLSAHEIVVLHEQLLEAPEFRGTRGGALPTVEPVSLPISPVSGPQASPNADVLIGHNADEGTFFFRSPWRPPPPPERIPGIVGHLLHSESPQDELASRRERAAATGTPVDDLSLLVEIGTEAMIAGPLTAWAQARARAVAGRSRVFRYRVDHAGAGPELGATHTTEVPLLFGTYRDGGPGERLGGQAGEQQTAAVSAALTRAWAKFIHDGSAGWTALTADPEALEVFG